MLHFNRNVNVQPNSVALLNFATAAFTSGADVTACI